MYITGDYFINHDLRIPSVNNEYDSWVSYPARLVFRGSGGTYIIAEAWMIGWFGGGPNPGN